MMSDVGENDQPENTPDNLPARPPAPQPPQESDWDPEKIRQFQEFLRFQQFQEFSRQQEQQQAQPTPPAGNRLLPAQQPSPGTGVEQQLAGMRRQLAEMSASQQRVEQVVNPPLWRKILRSNAVRWVAGLVVIAALAIWGVPALIDHYFGAGSANPGAYSEITSGHPIPLANNPPEYTISGIYANIAHGNVRNACQEYFSHTGQDQFAKANHVKTCQDAITALYKQVTDQDSYAYPQLQPMAQEPDRSRPVTISGCDINAPGGPTLGTFTLIYNADHLGWLVNGYTASGTCPSTTPATPSGGGF